MDRSPKGTYEPRQTGEVAAGGAESPAPVAGPSAGAGGDPRASGVPRRKVLAAGAGGGIGGNVAVILAFHFPQVPDVVVASYASLLVTVLAVAAAYLVPEG